MYDAKRRQKCKVKSWRISDSYGKVSYNTILILHSYIFTDKTGTLTDNTMILKSIYCNGKDYRIDDSFTYK